MPLRCRSRAGRRCLQICHLLQTPPRRRSLRTVAGAPAITVPGTPSPAPGESFLRGVAKIFLLYVRMKICKMREAVLLALCFIAFSARVWHFH